VNTCIEFISDFVASSLINTFPGSTDFLTCMTYTFDTVWLFKFYRNSPTALSKKKGLFN